MSEILIVAGSRSVVRPDPVIAALDEYVESHNVSRLVCGCAPGPDRAAYIWARANHIPIDFFPAWAWQLEWVEEVYDPTRGDTVRPPDYGYGRSNGPLRNAAMAAHADSALLIWDGVSRGTQDMKTRMQRARKPVFVVREKNVDSDAR